MKRLFGLGGALLLMASIATPALAATGDSGGGGGAAATLVAAKVATLAPNTFIWQDPGNDQPIAIVISIPEQKAYVYRGEDLVAASSVSTGKGGKDTPLGTFTILQKEEDHKSNLYNAAPMPFMQRLTWDGVALHAGRNPGFPASHGCVRMPADFAAKLFAVTSLGTPVLVTDATAAEGWALPEAYDTAAMQSETASANGAQLDAIMKSVK